MLGLVPCIVGLLDGTWHHKGRRDRLEKANMSGHLSHFIVRSVGCVVSGVCRLAFSLSVRSLCVVGRSSPSLLVVASSVHMLVHTL